jgi:hypothetical protein
LARIRPEINFCYEAEKSGHCTDEDQSTESVSDFIDDGCDEIGQDAQVANSFILTALRTEPV